MNIVICGLKLKKIFSSLDQLEDEIIEWGVVCLKNYNNTTETSNTLDHTCDTDDYHRINLLNKHGFVQQQFRSLQYMRDLNEPIIEYPLPSGFWIRSMKGKEEIEELVALHRSAFDTDNMTIEYRLAMMNSPQYIQELDLVAIAPDGKFAAFCVCGFDDKDKDIGYIDPIGTHPSYQKIGLGKAITSAGLMILKNRGAKKVKLGTSNENMAMQRLAKNLSFVCISEKLWFSKSV